MELHFADVGRLRDLLTTRRVSSVELVDAAIARIETRDSAINAIVVRDFARARERAQAADLALANGDGRPLLGVPMTVKESFDIAGLPTSWGVSEFRDWRPARDAAVVARLSEAGAIILGKSNVPLWLGDWQSDNPIYGRTANPWDLERTPGGSSGGAAAALAAGFVPLEFGSDIGGSIRVPAHFCGVFGHKSSFGLVPGRGHSVPESQASVDLGVTGPLARSAADLDLALTVAAGPDAPEFIAYQVALPATRHNALRDFRVLVIDDHPAAPVAASIREAIGALAGELIKLGTTVRFRDDRMPDIETATRLYLRLLMPILAAQQSPEAHTAMHRAADALSEADRSLTAERQRAKILPYRDWFAADQERQRLRQSWATLFGDWDVILCPAIGITAPRHDAASDWENRRYDIDGISVPAFDQILWSGIATGPGLPATVAPIGRDTSGLPIGIQIVGPFLEDRTTIGFAALLERAFGGFVPPPEFG